MFSPETIALIIPAFIAGVLTFLAPCTLPMVPAYLGFISGVSSDELKNKETAKRARKQMVLNGFFFIIGFSVIFIIFGTLAGLLGGGIGRYRVWLTYIGGAFVILFGLFMVGFFKIPFLAKEHRFSAPSFLKVGKPSTSLAIGSAFGLGWTPCVGPILGSILLLASTSSTALQGGFLLAIFSAGLAVPFLLVAFGYSGFIGKISKYLNVIQRVGGVFLILLGILLITNRFGLLIQYGYQFFGFIEYDRLLDYL